MHRQRSASYPTMQTSLLLLGCVILLLIFVRFDRADRELDTDESFTASYGRTPALQDVLVDVRKNEETPPLYFIIIWGWATLFGTSETALRLFSTFVGLALIGVYVFFVRRWLPPLQATLASLTLGLFGPLASYMLVARAYVLLLLLSVMCIALFEALYHQPDRRSLYWWYGLSAAALLLTHYVGSMLLLAHQFFWLRRIWPDQTHRRQRLARWLMVQVGIGATLALWLPSLVYQVRIASAVTVDQSAGWLSYVLLILSIPTRLTNGPLLLGIMISLGAWMLILLGVRTEQRQHRQLLRRVFVVPAVLLVVLLAITGAFALRYLLLILPGAAMSVALGWHLVFSHSRWVGIVAISAVLGGLLLNQVIGLSKPVPPNPWPPLTAHVAAAVQPNDCIVMHAPWDVRLFMYYYNGPAVCVLGAYHYDDFYVTEGHSMKTSWTAEEVLTATRGKQRVWIFDNHTYVMPRLKLPYPLLEHRQVGDIELSLYALPPAP